MLFQNAHLNVLAQSCQQDEDFVGHLASLSRTSVPAVVQSKRIELYLMNLKWWKQIAELSHYITGAQEDTSTYIKNMRLFESAWVLLRLSSVPIYQTARLVSWLSQVSLGFLSDSLRVQGFWCCITLWIRMWKSSLALGCPNHSCKRRECWTAGALRRDSSVWARSKHDLKVEFEMTLLGFLISSMSAAESKNV